MCGFYRWLTKTPKGAYSYTGGEQRQLCGAKSREASAGGQRVCARRTRVSDAITTRGRIGRNWAMCEAGGWNGISETIKKRLDFYRTRRRTNFLTRSLTYFLITRTNAQGGMQLKKQQWRKNIWKKPGIKAKKKVKSRSVFSPVFFRPSGFFSTPFFPGFFPSDFLLVGRD